MKIYLKIVLLSIIFTFLMFYIIAMSNHFSGDNKYYLYNKKFEGLTNVDPNSMIGQNLINGNPIVQDFDYTNPSIPDVIIKSMIQNAADAGIQMPQPGTGNTSNLASINNSLSHISGLNSNIETGLNTANLASMAAADGGTGINALKKLVGSSSGLSPVYGAQIGNGPVVSGTNNIPGFSPGFSTTISPMSIPGSIPSPAPGSIPSPAPGSIPSPAPSRTPAPSPSFVPTPSPSFVPTPSPSPNVSPMSIPSPAPAPDQAIPINASSVCDMRSCSTSLPASTYILSPSTK